MNLDLVAAIFIGTAILFVLAASWILFRRNWVLAWLRGSGGILLLLVAAYLGLMAANLFHYDDLTEDKPLATLSFSQKSDQNFVVTVADASDRREQYEMRGDLWQLDSRILRWRGFIAMFGIKPAYQLDRISGRYINLEDERSKPRTVHGLAQSSFGVDLWESAKSGLNIFASGEYGSATYMPMADGAIYEVLLSESGLVASPLNANAEQALVNWK